MNSWCGRIFTLLALVVAVCMGVHGSYIPIHGEPISVRQHDPHFATKPYVDGSKQFFGGKISQYPGATSDITSPIVDETTGERAIIGKLAQMKTGDVIKIINSAKSAWNGGRGAWTQMPVSSRIEAIQNVVKDLKKKREEIINLLMWEICKNADDAAAEFDRTMKFIEESIRSYIETDAKEGSWANISGIFAKFRRAAIGIVLCLGPFNYPFNETYATLIPALLAGNVVVMKIPNIGGLAHILTMEAYAKHLPPGTINFFSGSGRELLKPAMETGDIDALAFIGGSEAADLIIKAHPHPHKLRTFLQLEGKNLGIILPDADLDVAVKQTIIGSTNFNGQRCTAIKLVLVHESVAEEFLRKFTAGINKLKFGLPWEPGVSITPLPETKKIQYLNRLLDDAHTHGASIINRDQGGGMVHGGLMRPAVVYPVTSNMRLWVEEQFGPLIPVGTYKNIEEIYDYVEKSPFGQQAAVFTKDPLAFAELLDVLAVNVGRVNINTQCGRSPDSVPFSGRKSSALGTMSISEALRAFSIETVVAGKHSAANEKLMRSAESQSNFLAPMEPQKKAVATSLMDKSDKELLEFDRSNEF